jgi:hypothetical protein
VLRARTKGTLAALGAADRRAGWSVEPATIFCLIAWSRPFILMGCNTRPTRHLGQSPPAMAPGPRTKPREEPQ